MPTTTLAKTNGSLLVAMVLATAVTAAILAKPALAVGYSTVYSFSAATDGSNPQSTLVLADGRLFGTTHSGGSDHVGTVFSMKPDGSNFQLVHTFVGGTDGASPLAGLSLVGSTLYGTTELGGANGGGVAYSVNVDGSGYQVLHTFDGTGPGSYPYTGNLAVSGSKLYGVAAGDYGSIYSMNLDGSNFTILHAFTGFFSDGYAPYGSVTIVGSQLFGTTGGGGAPNDGLVYSMNLDGSSYQVLHTFTGVSVTFPGDGANPTGGMIANGDYLYGTTSRGGGLDMGAIFAMKMDGSDYRLVHSFISHIGVGALPNEGQSPIGPLVLVGSTLYGTTQVGGAQRANGGVIYSVHLDGSGFTLPHQFVFNGDGGTPSAGVTLIGSTLYGTTQSGGVSGAGTVFALDVPEPGSCALSAIALVALSAVAARRRRNRLGALRRR